MLEPSSYHCLRQTIDHVTGHTLATINHKYSSRCGYAVAYFCINLLSGERTCNSVLRRTPDELFSSGRASDTPRQPFRMTLYPANLHQNTLFQLSPDNFVQFMRGHCPHEGSMLGIWRVVSYLNEFWNGYLSGGGARLSGTRRQPHGVALVWGRGCGRTVCLLPVTVQLRWSVAREGNILWNDDFYFDVQF